MCWELRIASAVNSTLNQQAKEIYTENTVQFCGGMNLHKERSNMDRCNN